MFRPAVDEPAAGFTEYLRHLVLLVYIICSLFGLRPKEEEIKKIKYFSLTTTTTSSSTVVVLIYYNICLLCTVTSIYYYLLTRSKLQLDEAQHGTDSTAQDR